jgi:hypothetical protein
MAINFCYAGWPVGKGRTVIGLGYNFYYSSKIYDEKWHLTDPASKNDYFKSNFYSLYVAHGITRHLDFIGTASYLSQTSRQNNNVSKRSDFGDAMMGLSYSLENKDYSKYISGQASFIFPMYSNPTGELMMGLGMKGIDLTVTYNEVPAFINKNGFTLYSLTYRKYFGDDGPQQLIASASATFIIKRFQQFTVGLQGVGSYSSNTSSNLNPNAVKDFNSLKLNVNYGRKLVRTVILYGSAFYTLMGRNTSQGLGVGANMIIKLP